MLLIDSLAQLVFDQGTLLLGILDLFLSSERKARGKISDGERIEEEKKGNHRRIKNIERSECMQVTRVDKDLLLLDQDPALVVLQFFDFARDISQFLGFLPLLLGRQKLVRFKFGVAVLRLEILIFEADQVFALSRRTLRTSEPVL